MRRLFCVTVIAAAAAALLSGCGGKETVYVYNWADYIGEGVLKQFTKETGITVKYDTFENNEIMYTKVKNGGGSYDVLFPSDYMIERMISEDMLETLDFGNIPNFTRINPRFKGLHYDLEDKYSVAYMWGTVGILYNTSMVSEPVESWDILWDEDYSGKIFMYDSERDTIGLSLKRLGYSLNTRDSSALKEAAAALVAQRRLVKAYLGDPIKDKMIGREGALAVTYSGDAQYCQGLNPELAYAIPNEGSNVFCDGMVVPKGARNKTNAEVFINFMCRPEIAAQNSEYIGYATTNKDAAGFMDAAFAENPIYSPAREDLDRCEFFYDLGSFKKEYSDAWNEILMSGR